MVTAAQALKKYGEPTLEASMIILHTADIGSMIPARIYCNKDIAIPLKNALDKIKERGLLQLIVSWDGCFNIRKKRNSKSTSLHSWGLAIDINAAFNKLGQTPTMSSSIVSCFKKEGFDWGGDWTHPDGMHFQIAKI